MAATFWLYSHNFTHSGAPLVLAAIARDLAAAGLRDQLRIVSWGGLHDRRHSNLHYQLIAEGIKCQVLDPDQPPPRVNSGDRLLLNTIALPDSVILQALAWLAEGQLERLDWYVHESDPQIWILSDATRSLIRDALMLPGIHMRVPSLHVLRIYQRWLNYIGNAIAVQCPRVESLDKNLLQDDDCVCFTDLRLVLVGAVGYGNKGHLWLLKLVDLALSRIPNDTPGYRSIRLSFLGLETGRFAALARHCVNYGKNLLESNFYWKDNCPRELLVSELSKSNILVNCSLKESFSCVSSEALSMGLLLMRMRNGGFEEQLIPSCTGFDLGNPHPEVFESQLETLQDIRNYAKNSDSKLANMSSLARSHGKKFEEISYIKWLLQD